MICTSILSKDGRFRATVQQRADGRHEVSLWRRSGRIDSRTTGASWLYRRIENGKLPGKKLVPFHIACDMVEELVWPMTED